jgi:DNA recombination protein RmuC
VDHPLLLLLALGIGFVAGAALASSLTWLYAQARTAQLRAQAAADAHKTTWLDNAQQHLRDLFQALAAQSLRDNAADVAQRIQYQLGSHADQIGLLKQALERTLDQLDGNLRDLEQRREGAYQGLSQHVEHLAQAHAALRHTTEQLRAALQAGPVRGRWGEIQLRRVVELAGMTAHVSFVEQLAGVSGGRPDSVVHLPNDGHIPIDAKFPLQAFLEALQAPDEARRKDKLAAHVRSLKDKIRELSAKHYWRDFDPAPELAILFIPVESCLAAAYEQEPSLLDFALEHQVLLASPVSLLGFLKSIAYGWQQFTMSHNARLILIQGKELYDRLGTWMGHMGRTGEKLAAAVQCYNEAVASLQARFLPACRRFQGLAALAGALEEVEAIGVGVHRPDAPPPDAAAPEPPETGPTARSRGRPRQTGRTGEAD